MSKTSTLFLKFSAGLILASVLSACGGMGHFHVQNLTLSSNQGLEVPDDDGWSDGGPYIPPTPPSPVQPSPSEEDGDLWVGLNICTKLDFDGLDWTESLKTFHREPFALALNVTGSFEGVSGWQNLTGNFDGQGISMGLLQWNLGQGSLQPIWNDMVSRYGSQFSAELTAAQMTSVKGMLTKWNSYSKSSTIDIRDYGYNELDDPEVIAKDLGMSVEDILIVTSALTTQNQESVNWAKTNLLSGTSIKTDWSNRLKKIALKPGYRSLQAERAQTIHTRAIALFDTYKMTQLRSYLVFFDIVVQNGGISTAVYNQYQTWLKSNPSSNEYTRMKKLIDLRVAVANPQWQSDVRARKMTLLDGTGTVHGSKRDINKEYCANIQAPMP